MKKAIIKQSLEKSSNYEELSQKRSEFIMKHINQSQLQQQQSLSTQIHLIQKEEVNTEHGEFLHSALVGGLFLQRDPL